MTGLSLSKLTSSLSLSVLLATGLFSSVSHGGKVEDGIVERIKPVGSVCVEGEECKGVDVTSTGGTGEPSGPRAGSDVYTKSCFGCHGTGAGGAPKLGDAAAWATRAEKGMDGLLATAISGIGGMPPKGLCMDCSDEELKGAIQHILDNSK